MKMPELTRPEEIVSVISKVNCDPSEISQIAKNVTRITIKKLMLVIDMSTQGGIPLTCKNFLSCLEDLDQG